MMGATNGSVGRNWGHVFKGDAFALAEPREKNECGKSDSLENDRNSKGPPFDEAGAFFGLRVAFDKAPAE
jgi:hypothetical protein